jgi:hypothetical protein
VECGYVPPDTQTTDLDTLRAELAIRKQQIGLMGNCLSHIQNSPIAPEPIRIAATAAIMGASDLWRRKDAENHG